MFYPIFHFFWPSHLPTCVYLVLKPIFFEQRGGGGILQLRPKAHRVGGGWGSGGNNGYLFVTISFAVNWKWVVTPIACVLNARH